MERPKAATGPVYRRCTPILLAGHTVSAGGYSEFVENFMCCVSVTKGRLVGSNQPYDPGENLGQ